MQMAEKQFQEKKYRNKKKYIPQTIKVHPDAFDLSADVHEWCKLNRGFPIYTYIHENPL